MLRNLKNLGKKFKNYQEKIKKKEKNFKRKGNLRKFFLYRLDYIYRK